MTKSTRLFFSFLWLSYFSFSQAPSIEWQKTFGGSSDDWAWDIRQTSSGDYFVVGETFSSDQDITLNHGNSDYWVLKLDGSGNLLWEKSYGGTSEETAYSLVLTDDGGCIIAGLANSNDGDVTGHHGSTVTSDFWVIRINDSGNLLWEKSFGSDDEDEAHSIVQTPDGSYAITGWAGANNGDVTGWHGFLDYWVIVIDENGNLLKKKCLGGSGVDKAYGIQNAGNHSLIITGETSSVNGDITTTLGNDAWAVLLDSSLSIIYQNCYGGTNYESGKQIHPVGEDGFLSIAAVGSDDGDVTGHHGNVGGNDYWLVKMDDILQVEWQKCFGGSGEDLPWSLEPLSDGNYIIGGGAFSPDGDITQHLGSFDDWLVKCDAVGNLLWEKSVGGSSGDGARIIRETSDHGYIIAGYTSSANGDVSLNHGGLDVWIVKLSAETATGIAPLNETSFSVYPNPASSDVNVLLSTHQADDHYTLNLLDSYGRNLHSYQPTSQQINLSLDQLPKGMYILSLEKNGILVSQKLLLVN